MTVGTIFEKSDTPLSKWFTAIDMIIAGASYKDLERALGVTYKTAWRIGHAVKEDLEAGGICRYIVR